MMCRRAIAHHRRRRNDGGLPRARLSTRHRQQDACVSPAEGDARVVRDIFRARADTTVTPNRASLDATIKEKLAGVH